MGMGFRLQIPELESCKPEFKDCRKKSSQDCFLNAVGDLRYEILDRA